MNLFIPKRIRVGYKKREGTYTNRLAFIIYYDAKGKLRKETSWQNWRDDDIEPEEFDNTPQDGFHLNKGMVRHNWSHFGSNTAVIRMYDTRGIEFEITPENLVGILTETTCSKRGLEGEFVYAWVGTELVLLPCGSEAYQKATAFTELQGQKISARQLVPGVTYTTKKGEQVIYMGRFPWFNWKGRDEHCRISAKKHVFAHPKRPAKGYLGRQVSRFFPKSDVTFLSVINSPEPVQNYAELIEEWNGDIHSSIIASWESRPVKVTDDIFTLQKHRYYGFEPGRTTFTEQDGDTIIFWNLSINFHNNWSNKPGSVRGYILTKAGTLDTKTCKYVSDYCNGHRFQMTILSEQDVRQHLAKFNEVDMVLSSSKKITIEKMETIFEQ